MGRQQRRWRWIQPIDLETEPSVFEREEEDEEEEEMTNPNLEWMSQGPLALPAVLHKIPKRMERMNIKLVFLETPELYSKQVTWGKSS